MPNVSGSLLGMILAIALPVMVTISFVVALASALEILGAPSRSAFPGGYRLVEAAAYDRVQYFFVFQPQVLLVVLVIAAAVTGVGMLLAWAFTSLAARRGGTITRPG